MNGADLQRRLGVTPDGIIGPVTYAKLFAYVANRDLGDVGRDLGVGAAQHFPAYGIITPLRLAHFLGQTCEESGGYTRFEENLRYSAKRLCQVWPNRFPTLASALPYAWDSTDPDREDVALANFTYGSRMGNEANGTADNDGWDHRGRGLLDHTGAAEYALLKTRLGVDPDQVSNPATAVLCALDYWSRKNINQLADRGDVAAVTRAVNGALIGLDERKRLTNRAKAILLGDDS